MLSKGSLVVVGAFFCVGVFGAALLAGAGSWEIRGAVADTISLFVGLAGLMLVVLPLVARGVERRRPQVGAGDPAFDRPGCAEVPPGEEPGNEGRGLSGEGTPVDARPATARRMFEAQATRDGCLVRIVLAIGGLLVGSSAAVAGIAGSQVPDQPPVGPNSLEKITYLTSFGTFGRDAYAYVAMDKGYFKDAGFDVDIKAGNGTLENLKAVVGGRSQFTPMDLTGLLLAAGQAKDPVTGFATVAGIQQRTMAAIISLQGGGVTTPKDLEGKTLADSPDSVVRNLFPTYAKLAGIDDKKVTWQNGTPQTLTGTLASGKVAGIGQCVVDKATVEAIAKKPAVVLPYSDYLHDLYGNVLVTSSSYAQANPDKVKKFTAALLKGLRYSISNPAVAGAVLHTYVPTQDAQSAAAEVQLMGPFVKSEASSVPVGALDSQRVARSIAILQGSGQIQPGLTPEKVIDFNLVPKA